jgi:hypothetical protein
MGGCEGKLLFGTIIGRVVVGSSRGRIGNAMVGTGFDGSFVPCAEALPANMEAQKTMANNNIDACIFLPSIMAQHNPTDQVPAAGQAFLGPAPIN